jgi:hypothetical protein
VFCEGSNDNNAVSNSAIRIGVILLSEGRRGGISLQSNINFTLSNPKTILLLLLRPIKKTENNMKIAVAKGDGIGPEIMDAVLHVFDAAQVPLQYEFIEMEKPISNRETVRA